VRLDKRNIISTDKIQEINEALFIIRHFVDISARLLPILAELEIKENLSPQEQIDKQKIKTVFDSYSFDSVSSEILMDSPILELIKDAYHELISRDKNDLHNAFRSFRKEHERLKKMWSHAALN
jgi:hypothetical protein